MSIKEYAPFDQEELVPDEIWHNMPNSITLIRAWNARLGLEQQSYMGRFPTRLPYRKVEGNPLLVSVDKKYWDMLQKHAKYNISLR